MFVLVNALALAFICYAYLRMINEIKASGVACRSTQQSQDRDKVAQRFAIIVFTDCACWVPVIIVKLTALTGEILGCFPAQLSEIFFRRPDLGRLVRMASDSGTSDQLGVKSGTLHVDDDDVQETSNAMKDV